MPKTEKRKIGDIGEELVSRFLVKQGYRIIERNYLRKWGEIDIVAENGGVLHFVEVKSLTWHPAIRLPHLATGLPSEYMPEANVRLWKKQRMTRAIKTYLLDRKIPDDIEFRIDIAAVFLDFKRKKAKVRILENVILE